jgi:hypothetical protein
MPAGYGRLFGRMVEKELNAARGDLTLALLGSMVDPGEYPPDSFMALHECADVFGRRGWLRKLARDVPVLYLPGGSDAFLYNSAELRSALEPIKVITDQLILVPEDSLDRQFSLHHGWSAEAWNEPASKPLPRLTRGPLRGLCQFAVSHLTRGAEAPTALTAAIASHRIREACADDAKTDKGMLGVVHGGTEPYWGKFNDIYAGCPGDIGHTVYLNPHSPDQSYLVDLL